MNLNDFQQFPPGAIIAEGLIENSEKGIYMTNENKGKMLKWVAKKGDGGNDWAVYVLWATNVLFHGEETSTRTVCEYGDKVRNEANIKKVVPCDQDVFDLYRY